VVIKVFFAVLVLCTVAVVAVVLAIHFRVKRHLREEPSAVPEIRPTGVEEQTTGVSSPPAEDSTNEKLS